MRKEMIIANQVKGTRNEEEQVEIKGRSIGAIMWIKFKRNRLAMIGLGILIFLYVTTFLCEFLTPYTLKDRMKRFENHPPTPIHFVDKNGKFHLRPFVYGYERKADFATYRVTWELNPEKIYPIHFFTSRGTEYPLFGFLRIKLNLRLFTVKEGHIFLFGTDKWGRDTLSRIFYGGRISLTIGWSVP